MARTSWPAVQYDQIQLQGGLDLITPTLELAPGICRDALNFEASITGGYTRIAGYERYDGRLAIPSAATYSAMTLTALGTIVVGSAITGATSGATATVCGVNTALLGNTIGYTNVTGTFVVGEGIKVSGVTQGVTTAVAVAVTDNLTNAQWTAGAADVYRALIGAVPGSGPIRGVGYLSGTVYAFRDNAGATAIALYKSTTSGWTLVPFGKELSFSTGAGTQPAVGATVTGGTSAATGVIARVVQQTGGSTWVGGSGRFVFSSTTGTFSNGEALKVGGVTIATCVGTQSTIAPQAGGTYVIVNGNVAGGGGSANTRMYGCDGLNRGFEFDGTTYVPITTGMTADTPTVPIVHRGRLFFAFGPSLQFSSTGLPYQWSIVTGAGEISLPENITDLIPLPGNQGTGALAIFMVGNTYVLYGTDTSSFTLVQYNTGGGAMFNTASNLADTYVLDSRGVVALTATLNYGNFDVNTLTLGIRPFIQSRRNLATCTLINREKAQYRVFYSDGYGTYLTIRNKQYMGAMPVQFPNVVRCAVEGAIANGSETAFFGSDGGYVYQLDSGTSFDGQPISAYLTLVVNHTSSPRILKRYRKASLEMTGSSYAAFQFSYNLAYTSSDVGQPMQATYASAFSPVFWDAMTWDSFTWDGKVLSPTEVEVAGTAENIAIAITSNINYAASFTINSVILHYTPRRGLR